MNDIFAHRLVKSERGYLLAARQYRVSVMDQTFELAVTVSLTADMYRSFETARAIIFCFLYQAVPVRNYLVR